MKLSQLGEWALIEQISKQFARNRLPQGTLGIGDDAAVVPWDEKSSLLVTTDMLLEGTHFLKTDISPKDLGYKSLAVNLSDIAAMGGIPTSAFLSLGLPRDLEVSWLQQFFEGFQELADPFQVALLGGDTTESKNGIAINVVVLGKAENSSIKLRSSAKPGDLICVTGNLGDSAAGLRLFFEKKPLDPFLVTQHQRPKPYVTEGRWLASQLGTHAMMDISDGLDLTLKQVLQKSNCGAVISLNDFPLSENFKAACAQYNWNPWELAAAGGEEYGLLVTISPREAAQISREYSKEFSQKLTVIGNITEETGSLRYELDGKLFQGKIQDWNHFQT